ncbi:transcriptional regulator ATRX-like [Aedes albopictus]|uniref:Transcriptional regulator ATRX n=1 Tax=Aedes albopictus TaxID=7160 RepID=A0ABM1Z7C7_AEDAL
MGGKRKSAVKTRSSRRQLRSAKTPPPPSESSTSADENHGRGVTPTPSPDSVGTFGRRRRRLRKRAKVMESSSVDTEEDEEERDKSQRKAGEDSDSTADDGDPVARVEELNRLALFIREVRNMGKEVGTACDELEDALNDEAEAELGRLKTKLIGLTEKFYQKIMRISKTAETTSKKAQKIQPGRAQKDNIDDVSVSPKTSKSRSNSVDYTDYTPPQEPEKCEVSETVRADDSTAKDSGNPSSGHEESATTTKGSAEEIPTYVALECHSPTPVYFDDCEPEPIRDVPNDETRETVPDMETDSAIAPVPDDDTENFYNPTLFKEEANEVELDKVQDEPAQSNAETYSKPDNVEDDRTSDIEGESVVNDSIFGFHNYATPQRRNPERPPPVADTVKLAIKKESFEQRKQQAAMSTPCGTRGIGQRKLVIVGAKPNFTITAVPCEPPSAVRSPLPENPVPVKPDPDTKPLYQPEPSTSKDLDVKLIEKPNKSDKDEFVTNADPNPNRKPTNDEIRYIVPHLPKFSVSQVPQGENYELTLMKQEIEQRLRVNDLSWVTQRAIRDETARIKKVNRNNERLTRELERFGGTLSANQLILDYDSDKKTFIRVHPELVAKMKPHQKEGIKFMYDCCYGGSSKDRNAPGSGCILAHCMGLGKTMQVIALMNTVICYPQLSTKRIIVVCPKSTVMNWAQEIRYWLGDIPSGATVQVFHLPESSNIYKKMEVLRGFHNVTSKNAHCLLIGYEAFRSLVFYDARNKNGEQHSDRIRTEVRRILINPGADLIVLDEGHIIKNRKSQTNLSVSEVATKRRIILTGTPIQNNLNEYFCMVSFVKPAYLGDEREFNEQYARPIRDGQHKDSSPGDIRYMKTKSFILHKHLESFVQRKEFSVLQGFLPEKYEYVLYVPLTPVQEDLYEQYLQRNPFRKDVGGRNLLEDYTFMRKIWTHPIVLEKAWETAMKKKYGIKEKRKAARRVRGFDSSSEDDDDNDADNARSITNIWWKQIISKDDLESLYPSNKMILLFEILRMCQEKGEKCLIFSGFVMVLNMVEYFMKMIDEQSKNPKAHLHGLSRFRGPWRPGMDYYRLDGGTSKSIRHEMINKFNDPKNRVTRVFLISTKAGGQGINLVGANRVVILDTSWNPAVDQQGIFRIYRLGQQKPCYIYRLLAIHTMEEKVYSRAVTKQAMSHRVADKKQVDRNYNMAELEELYHFERVNMSARSNPPPAVDDLLSTLLLKFPKLIFRYHTHETMLDNKNEEDLTEFEKKLAWREFKKKGLMMSLELGMGADGAGELDKADSQMSELDVDPELRDMFEKSCTPKTEPIDLEPVDNTPLIIPVRKSFGKRFDEKLMDVDPDPVEEDSAIFGEDPYNEISLGRSIIEEQRQKLGIKMEPGISTPSQVNVSKAEVDLLRTLEEDKEHRPLPVQIKQEPQELVTQDIVREAPVVESVDLLDLSYESGQSTLNDQSESSTAPTVSAVKEQLSVDSSSPSIIIGPDTLSSMIEYDPLTSSQDHIVTEACANSCRESMEATDNSTAETSTYEKFEARLKSNPTVTTSTAAPPPSVVLVATATGHFQVEVQMHGADSRASISVEPLLTRSMKRKMMAAGSPAASNPKKAKIYSTRDATVQLSSAQTNDHQKSNQCRALVPYVNHSGTRVTLNVHLREYLDQNNQIIIPNNCCRALAPYVKRVSLLDDILRSCGCFSQISGSYQLPLVQVDSDAKDMERSTIPAVRQTTTLSWNDEEVNFADLETWYEESSGQYYTAETEFYSVHDESDPLTLTQCTLPESQQAYTQQAIEVGNEQELINHLEELRAALSDEVQENEAGPANCSAVVPYCPPVSIWDEQKYDRLKAEAPQMVLYRPVRSFWDQKNYSMRMVQVERRRQIIRNQHNKCYRFIPYNKDDRKWAKEIPPTYVENADICADALLPLPVLPTNAPNECSSIMHRTKPAAVVSMALLPYTGNCILNAIQGRVLRPEPNSVVLSSELTEYLSFCRNVTCQSSSQGIPSPKANRGVKRKRENLSQTLETPKKSKNSKSEFILPAVLGDRNR